MELDHDFKSKFFLSQILRRPERQLFVGLFSCSYRSSQLGPAWRLLAGPFEKKGGKHIQPPKF